MGSSEADVERSLGNAVLQRCPVQKLHGNEGLGIVLADFVNGADVGVVQGGSRARLTTETLQGLCILGNTFRQELHGDKAAQFRIFGLVHHSHAAASELAGNFVVGKALADHWKCNLRLGQRCSQSSILISPLIQAGFPDRAPTHRLRTSAVLTAFPGPARSALHR